MVPLHQAYSQMVFFFSDSGKTSLGRGGEDICTDTCEVTRAPGILGVKDTYK